MVVKYSDSVVKHMDLSIHEDIFYNLEHVDSALKYDPRVTGLIGRAIG